MATTFITTDQTGLIAMGSGDELVILPGVNVTSTTDAFTFPEFGSLEITVAGGLFVDDDLIDHGFNPTFSTSVDVLLNVTSGGTVVAGGDLWALTATDPDITTANLVISNAGYIGVGETAVFANGFDYIEIINSGVFTQLGTEGDDDQALFDELGSGDAKIVNDGIMQTAQGSPIIGDSLVAGAVVELTNTGLISSSADTAFSFGGSILGTVSIVNSGVITGNLTSAPRVELDNIGTFTGSVVTGSALDSVNNSGKLTGTINLLAGDDTVINSGEIVGDIDSGTQDDKLVNSGAITGNVDTSNGNDTVVNSGTINGVVDLGINDDLFKTAGTGFVSDTVNGEAGNDTLRGGGFDDTLNGGDDDDLLRGKGGEDDLIGGSGNDTLFGGNDNDVLTGDDGDDELRGGNGNDTLVGGGNKDELIGGTGNDTMEGGAGNDTLRGGAGDDTIAGQNGSDEMSGGAGADIFLFTNANHSAVGSRDDILDFQKGQDKIDIDGLSNDTFIFLGNSAFTASGEAEVRVTSNGAGNSVVRIDTDGDGLADSEIDVLGVTGLEAGDFIL